jgi:hypothetical protein
VVETIGYRFAIEIFPDALAAAVDLPLPAPLSWTFRNLSPFFPGSFRTPPPPSRHLPAAASDRRGRWQLVVQAALFCGPIQGRTHMHGRAIAAITYGTLIAAVTAGCGQTPTEPTPATAVSIAQTLSPTTGRTVTGQQRARGSISFTLSSCPNLPAGLTVSGSGDDFLVVNSRVDQDGVTHMERNDLVTGTATDSNGATYGFNYHNHSNITVPPGGFPWSFTTTDHFNLVGNGHADQLQVHFVAWVTFPSPSDPPLIEFVNSSGNPFFCDPI